MQDQFLQQSLSCSPFHEQTHWEEKLPASQQKAAALSTGIWWYLVKFTTQDRKSIAKEAEYENTGFASVLLASVSSLISSEPSVSHYLRQKLKLASPKLLWSLVTKWRCPGPGFRGYPSPTAAAAVSAVTAWDIHTECPFALRSWTSCGPDSNSLRNAFPKHLKTKGLLICLTLCFLLSV